MVNTDAAAALLSAAVRAAVQSGAPRRTVAAVAASTAGALLGPLMDARATRPQSREQTAGAPGPSSDADLRKSRSARRRAKRRQRQRQQATTAAGDRAEPPAADVADAQDKESSKGGPRLEGGAQPASMSSSPQLEPPMKIQRVGDGKGDGILPQVPVFPLSLETLRDHDMDVGPHGFSARSAPTGCSSDSVLSARSKPPSDASDNAADRRPAASGGKRRNRRRKGRLKD